MRYEILAKELNGTLPNALDYTGLSDVATAARLNALDTGRTRNRTRVDVTEIFNAIDDGAWPTTAILQDKLRAILGMPFIDASNNNTRGILGTIFPNSGATLNTRNRLLALATETISRAVEIELGGVPTASDVAKARAGVW